MAGTAGCQPRAGRVETNGNQRGKPRKLICKMKRFPDLYQFTEQGGLDQSEQNMVILLLSIESLHQSYILSNIVAVTKIW